MKRLTFINWRNFLVCFILLSFCPGSLFAQQIIRYKSGNEYEVNIVYQTLDTVKYQMISNPSAIMVDLMERIESIRSLKQPDYSYIQIIKIRDENNVVASIACLTKDTLFYRLLSDTSRIRIVPMQEVEGIKTLVKRSSWEPSPSLLRIKFSSWPPLDQALSRLTKAQRVNIVGIILGGINHASLIINGGFLTDDWDDNPYKIPVAVIGASCGGVRLGFSFVTLTQLLKAEKAVIRLQQTPGNEEKFQRSLKNIQVAKYLSMAVPVMGLTAVGLMIGGYCQDGIDSDGKMNGYFIAAWAVMGATLATTIVSTIYISKARKLLLNESGSFSMGMNQSGVGFTYKF